MVSERGKNTAEVMIRVLPLVTGLLPIVAIHLSLIVAIEAGVIPVCIPYLDGCASISATGRYEPASFIFKPAMLSEAMILVMYWLYCVAWVRTLAIQAGQNPKAGTWIGIFGCAGALALILYVTFLGTQAPFYEFMRRFGVYLYFLFSVVAQILLARSTIALSGHLKLHKLQTLGRFQMTLALIPFGIGALNLVLKSTLENPDPAENVIEWIFAFFMHVYFVLTYFAWKQTGFGGRFTVDLRR